MEKMKVFRAVVGINMILCGLAVKANEVQSNDTDSGEVTSPSLEVIEVTSQKRTQSIQEVPLSVQA